MVHGEVDAALRAAEAGEAVGHVEDGLAVRARELDLRGVHTLSRRCAPPGLRMRRESRLRGGFGRRRRGGLGHELRREALRHAALGADELGHARCHGEDAAAAGAAHLDGGRRGGGGAAAGHRGGGAEGFGRRRGGGRGEGVSARGRLWGQRLGFLLGFWRFGNRRKCLELNLILIIII